MENYLKAEKISENVWWVGAIDWNVRNFHGYRTERGSTYNAYLVIDEKITLIDTVKAPFFEEMMSRVRSVIDPQKIDYIISNHAEPDHSGSLPRTIAAIQPEKVYASVAGVKALHAYYGNDLDITPVSTGDSINVGKGNFAFVDTKMLHWPDSMISFYDRDGVLFSQDAFGMHLAGNFRWAEQYDDYVLKHEVIKYFANILNLQAPKVIALLDSLPSLNLDIKVIAPDHGPLWHQNLDKIIALYREAAEQKPTRHAVIAYSTMWHATEILATALADGLTSKGIEVKSMDVHVSDRSAVMTEVAQSGLICFGAPTMNNQMFPAMADIMNYVKGLKPKNKLGFAFGSYGWSGEGGKQIAAVLTEMGVEQPVPMAQVKYMPDAEAAKKFFEIGATLGEELIARTK